MQNNVITRHDRNGVRLKEGDVVAQGHVGNVIWDGKGIVVRRPLGIITVCRNPISTPSLEPEETDCYNVMQIRAGEVKLTEKADQWMVDHLGGGEHKSSLHLSRYDGAFYAWDDIEVVGTVHDFPD